MGGCPVCASATHTAFMDHNGCHLRRCSGCGLVFMDPPPSAAVLHALYDQEYSGTPLYLAKAKKKMRRMRHRARQIAKVAGLKEQPQPLSFLDIGCSGGFMVEAAREQGFRAAGVEPDRMAVEFARATYPQNDYFEGLLETADLGGRQFDVIYCSEVIEHAPDCHAFLRQVTAVMKDDGLLYLTTPDIDHWRRPKNILDWDGFAPPGHCLYFNPRNLQKLLEQHGLTVVRRSFAWKPGIKLYARKGRTAGSVLGQNRAAA